MSVSEATRKVISRYPFIRESLSRDLVNYRALARKMSDEVSEECGEEVTLDAIVVAARRYREDLPGGPGQERISKILADARVSMRGNVGVITTGVGWDDERLGKIWEKVSDVEPLQLIQGRRLITVAADQDDVDRMVEEFGGDVKVKKKDLSMVTVISPEEISEVPGVIATMTQRLLGEGINIVEMMSCHTDTIFILERESAVAALKTMEDLIEDSKGKVK